MTNYLYLIDTCVLSELIRPAPAAFVVDWLERNSEYCVLSAVTVGEIQFGLDRMALGHRRNRLQLWFDGVCEEFHGRILASDEECWRHWSRLRVTCQSLGRPQADLDLLIAATASAYRLQLVTRNTKHFQDTGLTLVNPWEENRPH